MNEIFKKSRLWIILFTAPLLIVYTGIIVIPLFQTLYYSFFEWNGIKTGAFRGFGNYLKLFTARELDISLKNSLTYSLVLTIYQVGIGTLLAFILTNVKIKGKLIYRNIYFVPVLLSISVVSQLWIWIFNGDFGLINRLMETLGIAWRQNWLNRRGSSLFAVAFVDAWKGMGYIMLIIFTGLKSIPGTYLEVAEMEGSSSFQKFRYVTLPLAAPTIRVTVVMCVTYGFRAFETTFLMTGGGPGIYTYNLTILMYKAMFISNDYGYGSAVAMLIVVICITLMVLINRLTAKYDESYV